MDELGLDFVVMTYRQGDKCSLRSRGESNPDGKLPRTYEHAGVAQWADVQRFIDGLED